MQPPVCREKESIYPGLISAAAFRGEKGVILSVETYMIQKDDTSKDYKKHSIYLFLKTYFPACLGALFCVTALLSAADCPAADVTLAWEASPDPVTGYRVFYGRESVLSSDATEVPAGDGLETTITGLWPGQTYYFAVKAYHRNVESGFSNEVVYTVPDDAGPTGCTDEDGDGYAAEPGCVPAQDCDDLDAAVHPDAEEVCDDGIDNNCNGITDTDCGVLCPAESLLGQGDPGLERLRSLRDGILAGSPLGRKMIQLYYANADSVNAALESSPAFQAAARRALAALTALLEKRER